MIVAAERWRKIGIPRHLGRDGAVPNILKTSLGGPELQVYTLMLSTWASELSAWYMIDSLECDQIMSSHSFSKDKTGEAVMPGGWVLTDCLPSMVRGASRMVKGCYFFAGKTWHYLRTIWLRYEWEGKGGCEHWSRSLVLLFASTNNQVISCQKVRE